MVCKTRNVKRIACSHTVMSVLKVLSNSTRYKILLSVKDKPKTHCEIVNLVGRSQPTVAIHLNMLVKKSLLRREVDNGKVFYILSSNIKKLMIAIERCIKKNKSKVR